MIAAQPAGSPNLRVKAPPTEALKVLLLASAVVAVARGTFELRSALRLGPFAGGGRILPASELPRPLPPLVALAVSIASLATGIVWLVWQHRSHKTLHGLHIPELRFTPGWTVGWWFVPIANLFMPYQVNAELWRATTNDRSRPWRSTKVEPILPVWWGLYLADELIIIASFVASVVALHRTGPFVWERVSTIRVARFLVACSEVFRVGAATAGFVLVSKVELRLKRLLSDPPSPPRPDLLPVRSP